MNRVVITGMGWITPMGHSIEGVWKRLLNSESGIARTTLFDASTFPTTFSAEVKDYRLEDHVADLSKHQGVGRNTAFALGACAQAWKSAGLDQAKLDLDQVGIYLGSGEGPSGGRPASRAIVSTARAICSRSTASGTSW